jgi:transcriptional regulator with XRE-family HTH domain
MLKRDKTLTAFGRNVARFRTERGFSQDKLAEEAIVDRTAAYVSGYAAAQCGKAPPYRRSRSSLTRLRLGQGRRSLQSKYQCAGKASLTALARGRAARSAVTQMIGVELHLLLFPVYYSTAVKTKSTSTVQGNLDHTKADSSTRITCEYVYCLSGKLKGKGLLKALMAEKKNERSF